MKRLIIALLLLVFSAQGMGAAAGISIQNASRAFAHLEKNPAQSDTYLSVAAKSDADTEELKILSIAEELSDYVVLELILPSSRYHAPTVPTAAWIPILAFLPRALPPPRS